MARYRVWLKATATAVVDVEADSRDDAEEKAYESPRFPSGLCHHCAGKVDLGDFEPGDEKDDIELLEE